MKITCGQGDCGRFSVAYGQGDPVTWFRSLGWFYKVKGNHQVVVLCPKHAGEQA